MSNKYDSIMDLLEENPGFLKKGEFTSKQADFYRDLVEEYKKTGFTDDEKDRRENIQRSVEGWLEGVGIYTTKLFDRAAIDVMERYTKHEVGE